MRKEIYIASFGSVLLAATFLADRPGAVSDNSVSAAPTPIVAAPQTFVQTRNFAFIHVWDGEKLVLSNEDWKSELSAKEFYVLRQQGTEEAYTGKLTNNKRAGTYHCAACGLAMFSSKHKYDSQTGWPSFYQPIEKSHVGEAEDRSIPAEVRTEVHCRRCGGHLGHVFDDGPKPTGLRYCINSVSLRFKPLDRGLLPMKK